MISIPWGKFSFPACFYIERCVQFGDVWVGRWCDEGERGKNERREERGRDGLRGKERGKDEIR
jgi:hypothetical protein